MAGGALVAVIGPSGAGKDTLIGLARPHFLHDPRVMFARRVVTRPMGRWEEHDSLAPEAFATAEQAGAFALTWEAHGLRYGIPASTLDFVRAGGVAVANLSRAVVEPARQRCGTVRSVYVTAPAAILAERIAARGRDGEIAERLARAPAAPPPTAHDLIIENVGAPEAAALRLVSLIRALIAPASAS